MSGGWRKDCRSMAHEVNVPTDVSVLELAAQCEFAVCQLERCGRYEHPEYVPEKVWRRDFFLSVSAQGTPLIRANAEFLDRGLQRPSVREFLAFVAHHRDVLARNNIRVVLPMAFYRDGVPKHYLVAPAGKERLTLRAVLEAEVTADNYDLLGVV